jgi:ubiquinone/menaquinone biosynthesis C-methylase UbiE
MRPVAHGRGGLVPVNDQGANPYGVDGYDATTYGDSFAEVYDQWYADLDDADFLESIVRSLPDLPLRVLELGVGTGRLVAQWLSLRPTANDTIVGIDSSEAMLQIAQKKQFPAVVSFVRGDFSDELPNGPFDVVFIGYNTLFNVPDELALHSCFNHVARVLAPTGSLYIDAVIPNSTEASTHESVQTMATGENVLATSHHDPQSQRITGTFTHLEPEQGSHIRSWAVRYFSPAQLDQVAEQSGLALFSRFADGRQTAFTSDSHRHITRYSPAV